MRTSLPSRTVKLLARRLSSFRTGCSLAKSPSWFFGWSAVSGRSRETLTRHSSSHHLPSLPFSLPLQRRRRRTLSSAAGPLISVLGCEEFCFSVAPSPPQSPCSGASLIRSASSVWCSSLLAVTFSRVLSTPNFNESSSLKATSA